MSVVKMTAVLPLTVYAVALTYIRRGENLTKRGNMLLCCEVIWEPGVEPFEDRVAIMLARRKSAGAWRDQDGPFDEWEFHHAATTHLILNAS